MKRTEQEWTITYGNEYWKMREDGAISRPNLVTYNPDTWRVLGAVRLNNFGNVVERFSLDDIKAGKVGKWQYANGKQRIFVVDVDHGTHRRWCCPKHRIT